MTKENYYLACYQAIMDRNLTKALELSNLTDQEEENYPSEHPELNYNAVFEDNDRDDFLLSILKSEKFIDFYISLEADPLVTKENIAIRWANKLELMQYPLMDNCPNPAFGFLSLNMLLSSAYSTALSKEEVSSELKVIHGQSFIIDEVFSIVARSITIDSNKTFSIALIGENIIEYDPTMEYSTGGYHHSSENALVVTSENSELNVEFTIHELAHKMMGILFKNDQAPYNSALIKEKYHNAIKNTLLNIQTFIKQDFGLAIVFENKNNTWQMEKTLSTALFLQYLEGEKIQEFISFLKQYNLNINDEFSWLGGYTPLGYALSFKKFELASSLVEAGAVIKPITVHIAAMFNSSSLLNWFLGNQHEIDINYKDCEGMTVLDYASEPEIIKMLISAGASAYPANIEPVCTNNLQFQNIVEEDAEIKEEQLFALEKFLMLYNQYEKSEEDAEFIVRLPQIIAAGLYKGKIVEVFDPLNEYWQEEISPAAAAYHEQHDIGDLCLVSLVYSDLLD